MPKALQTWSVLPHGPLERLSASVITVTGDLKMPLTLLERRMTVVRLEGGRLLIYSAIALNEPQMQELEQFGRPSFLVVPNHWHRNDAFVWKERYPDLVVIAPSAARRGVEEVVRVDTSAPEFDDDRVRFLELPGTAGREAALEVREEGCLTLVLNDIVGNLPKSSGFVLRALGFASERPRVPRIVKRVLVKDAPALRLQFDAWAEQPVERILVSHGQPIVVDSQQVLRELASIL